MTNSRRCSFIRCVFLLERETIVFMKPDTLNRTHSIPTRHVWTLPSLPCCPRNSWGFRVIRCHRHHDPMNPLQTSLGIKGVESFSGIAEEILFPSLKRINDSVKNFTPRKNIIRDVLSNQDRILYKHSRLINGLLYIAKYSRNLSIIM